MKQIKIDTFLLLTFLIILIAYCFPQLGNQANKGILDNIISIGIAFIFFFYGLKLSIEKIKTGLKNWKLHFVIQFTTFVFFPFIIILFYPYIKGENYFYIWLSFLFLAALPSTVSTSVVMVSIAKGNLPAAIFNASISGLIGVFITPIWMGFFIMNNDVDYNLSYIYLKLIIEILIPVVLGLSLQRYFGDYVLKYVQILNKFDKSVILLIIYKSFAESFEQKIFSEVGTAYLFLVTFLCFLLFYLVYFFTGWVARFLNFNREDTITAQFCGTKKSLVHGTVFSKILIPATIPMGIILLPIMIFHAFQIFVITFIAERKFKEIL